MYAHATPTSHTAHASFWSDLRHGPILPALGISFAIALAALAVLIMGMALPAPSALAATAKAPTVATAATAKAPMVAPAATAKAPTVAPAATVTSAAVPAAAALAKGDPAFQSYLGFLAQRQAVQHRAVARRVLAFYYPWYQSEDFSGQYAHWDDVDAANHTIASATHYPVLGAYDSNDPAVVAQHLREMKAAGIDGVIVSWWGVGGYEEQPMSVILAEAEKQHMAVTVYLEAEELANSQARIDHTADDIAYIVREFGSSPAFLRVDGAPVIFAYGRVMGQLSGPEWAVATKAAQAEVGKVALIADGVSPLSVAAFDGAHDYNPLGMAQAAGDSLREVATAAFSANVNLEVAAGKISTVTVIPGYDDTKIRKPGASLDRKAGATYEAMWSAAIAANPDWVLITTFNEWHEGTEIEPSREYGTLYLDLTRQFTAKFKASPARTVSQAPPPPLATTEVEKAQLRKLYAGKRIALMPDLSPMSPAVLWAASVGFDLVALTRADIAAGLDPAAYPVLLYAGGETYSATSAKPLDVDKALAAYLKAGGALVALPSQPLPFFYNESGKAVNHAEALGFSISGGWETPPAGTSLALRTNPDVMSELATMAFPASGDLRWRPIRATNAKDLYVPFATLVDAAGRSLGDGAAYERHIASAPKGGRTAYVWFRLMDEPGAGELLYRLFTYMAGDLAK